MSALTIILHPVSDADTSAMNQLVLWGPGAPGDTDSLPNLGYHPSESDTISDLDAIHDSFQQQHDQGFDSGLAFRASAATSVGHEVIDLQVLHNEFVQVAKSYPSTYSSLSNAFGTECQTPAPPPPSPNHSTSPPLVPSEHESPSSVKVASSSLHDALGPDWLSSPLQLPFSFPSTPESQQTVLIVPTPPPTNTNPASYFETTLLGSPDTGGNYPLPTVEFFFPRIEEKKENNFISHHNGGIPICYYTFAVEQTDIDIRQRGERTVTSKKPEIRVESPISRKRKRDDDSETPVVKRPKIKNQGRRSDLEGFKWPEVKPVKKDNEKVDRRDDENENVVKNDAEKVVKKERKHRAISDRSIREKERPENAQHRTKKSSGATRA